MSWCRARGADTSAPWAIGPDPGVSDPSRLCTDLVRPTSGRTFETPTLEVLSCFDSFGAVKLAGELRGHEVRLGDHASRAYVMGGALAVLAADAPHMTGSMELARKTRKTGLSGGGDGGREGTGLAWDRDERIGVPLEQRAVGAGVQAGWVLGARVVSGRILSLTKVGSTSTG
jgi:hypothetical protein